MAPSESFIGAVILQVARHFVPSVAQRFVEQALDFPRMLQRVVGDKTHLWNPPQTEIPAELAAEESLGALESFDRLVDRHLSAERSDIHIGVLEIRRGLHTRYRDCADPRILALSTQKGGKFLEKKLVYAYDSPIGHIAFRAR